MRLSDNKLSDNKLSDTTSESGKKLPAIGRPLAQLEAELRPLLPDEVRGHWRRAFRGPPDVRAAGRLAYDMFQSDNALLSMRVDWMGRIESEVIQMCLSLFHSPEDAAGNFTSGGSESIYCALHAMREWAREKMPQITQPEVVAPYSAHPSFSKGCHYFGLKLRRVPLGPDLRASVENLEGGITRNTIGLIASAPCWPYGLYDPIESIAALAARLGLWMHVDACVGGYLAPFVERLGHAVPAWDFRVPGVMSISADLHKYGYCPKPASTILWRSASLQRHHYVHPSDWPGGAYSMSGFAGTRTAGPIFAAWTVLQYLGEEGYLQLARHLLGLKQRLVDGINAIEGLKAWRNDLMPVAFESTDVDLTTIKAELTQLGWAVIGCAEPPLINVPLDAGTDERIVDIFLEDLRELVQRARQGGIVRREALQY